MVTLLALLLVMGLVGYRVAQTGQHTDWPHKTSSRHLRLQTRIGGLGFWALGVALMRLRV